MADENYQVGVGLRGTSPFEYDNRNPDMVTILCTICEFQFELSLVDYRIQEPRTCPDCDEHNLLMSWVEPEVTPARPLKIRDRDILDLPVQFEPFAPTIKRQPGFYYVNIELYDCDLEFPVVAWIDDQYVLQEMDTTTLLTGLDVFSAEGVIIERLPYEWQRAVVHRKIIADFI